MAYQMLFDVAQKPRLSVEVDYIKSKHLVAVMKIDRECYAGPWSQDEFYGWISGGGYCVIAKNNGNPVGYAVYKTSGRSIHLERMGVVIGVRRHGVASALIRNVKRRATEGKRLRIVARVAERNTDAQCFFRAVDFKATPFDGCGYVNEFGELRMVHLMKTDRRTL